MIMRRFQSTLPMRGATRRLRARPRSPDAISIHAPRAGSDPVLGDLAREAETISIHAPRAGSDLFRHYSAQQYENFNPRSPCGERRQRSNPPPIIPGISIHAPRAGSDVIAAALALRYAEDFNPRSPCGERPGRKEMIDHGNQFQSTLPVRGAPRPPFVSAVSGV